MVALNRPLHKHVAIRFLRLFLMFDRGPNRTHLDGKLKIIVGKLFLMLFPIATLENKFENILGTW